MGWETGRGVGKEEFQGRRVMLAPDGGGSEGILYPIIVSRSLVRDRASEGDC